MTDATLSARSSRCTRALGASAQIAGVVGIGASVVLAVLMLFGRRWAVDRLGEFAGRIDEGIAKGSPLLDAAAQRVDGVAASVARVRDAVLARGAAPEAASELVQAVLDRATEAADGYLALRTTYADAREKVTSVLARLSTIDRLAPPSSPPLGPVEALASLDERVRALDARMLELLGGIPQAGTGPATAAVTERAERIGAALHDVTAGIGGARTRLDGLRDAIASWAESVRKTITLASIALLVAFLYVALLHGALFLTGRRMRAGSAPAR